MTEEPEDNLEEFVINLYCQIPLYYLLFKLYYIWDYEMWIKIDKWARIITENESQ